MTVPSRGTPPAPRTKDSGPTRRSVLGAALIGLAAAIGAGLTRGVSRVEAAARAVPGRLAARNIQPQVLSLKPRWASWTVDEVNAKKDGWSQPSHWMDTILNKTGLPISYDSFPNESRRPHHWAMVIDLRRCIGCQACVVACKSENNVPIGTYRTWVPVMETGSMMPDAQGPIVTDAGAYTSTVRRSALPRMCNHCDNPPCVVVCPVKATFKRDDGPVLIDPNVCIGCGICIQACPYDARYFNTVQETADKCTFCVHRLDRGLLPACVTSCVGRARVFGDLNDPESGVSKLLAKNPTNTLMPEVGTDPQIYYINLDGELVTGSTAFDTIYPYASGANTDEYDDLTGQVLLQSPLGGEPAAASGG